MTDAKAVVKIKGHQYLVEEKDRVKVSKIKAEAGDKLNLEDVFAVFNDKELKLGTPQVAGASVEAKVLRQLRGRKVIVLKYGSKTRRRIKRGFRPEYTELEITNIR
jgi:large subunit ribosomal protein L21